MADGTDLNLQDARHLLRRTGFGASQDDAQEFLNQYPHRGEAANHLLDFKPAGFKPGGRELAAIHDKWIKYMLKTKVPLQEKLVLFWHDHFATGFSKVLDAKLMSAQNKLFRTNCKSDLKAFVKAVTVNPAMMDFLDTARNHEEIPNENYARELQELFTLGVKDSFGVDNYVQADVAQIARAFTGWDYDKEAFFKDYDHDGHGSGHEFHPERGQPIGAPNPPGNKKIYLTTGGFGPSGADFASAGEGPQEIDTVIDIIFSHEDSTGKNTVARRTARRLIEFFAHANPSLSYIDEVCTESGFGTTNFDLSGLLHQIFVHDDFYLTAGAPIGAMTPKSVRWPVDYVVTSLRLLKMKLKGSDLYVDGGSYNSIFNQLSNMGQVLFDPPSVFGWDWETAWISSSTLLARYGFARDLTVARGGGGSSFRPGKVMDLDLDDPNDILLAATNALGITGDLTTGTNSEEEILIKYLTDNGANPTLDLNDYDTRNTKLHGLFALLMQMPAYQLQ